MSDNNALSGKQKNLYRMLIVIGLFLFLVAYLFYSWSKHKPIDKPTTIKNSTDSIIFKENKINAFGTEFPLVQYPDKVVIHDPYFVVVQPEKETSTIFDLNKKTKIKVEQKIVLDFDGARTLYNKNGLFSFLDNKDLKTECGIGFIVSKDEILCTVRVNPDLPINKLIKISVSTLKKQDVYVPKSVISAVSVFDGDTYVAEYDPNNKRGSIAINTNTLIPVDVPVNAFYRFNGSIYAASFPNAFNGMKEQYFKVVKMDNTYSLEKQPEGSIVFFK